MNVFRKTMVFATFFACCLAIALLVASLGTQQWLAARARRTSNPHESDGRINFGLFNGRKELNVAYGWRTYDMNVVEIMRDEDQFMIYGVWMGTICSVCAALLFTTVAAVFAVINTATNPTGSITGVPGLYAWNIFSLISECTSIGLWLAQYFLKLQHNVMMREDLKNMWTSNDMAQLGISFWFVVAAAVISFTNLIVIYIGTSEARDPEPVLPVLEEKTNGAIMLY